MSFQVKKIKIQIINMNFTIDFYIYNVSFKCIVRAWNSWGTADIQLVFCSSYVLMYFILRIVKHCIQLIQLFGFTSDNVYILPTLSTFILLMTGEGLKGKELEIVLSSFPSRSSFLVEVVGSTRSTVNQKGDDRISWLVLFLGSPLPSFCVGSKFCFKQKVWPLGDCHSPSTAYFIVKVTHLPPNPFEPCWTLTHVGHWNSAFIGHQECYMWMRHERTLAMLYVSLLLSHMPQYPIGLHL